MSGNFTASSQPTTLSSKAATRVRITRYFTVFSQALVILGGFTTAGKSAFVLPAALNTPSPPTFPSPSVEQNVQYQASLIRADLPVYLDFVSSDVLPVMSKNIDDILYDLHGLTDIRPGLFYHGHIDYSISVSGGIDGLMDMNNVVLQYHTLENPLIYIPYWREELGNIPDQDINAWLERINEYNQAISTPSAASQVEYTPLTEYEAVHIASRWEDYLSQNGLASPGTEMLTNMVYLIDGGRQPLYQESFKEIYRVHSIAFTPHGYLQLDNKTHLENTFSPFQITFESVVECRELLPVFEEARAAGLGYILNLNNEYVAHAAHADSSPELLHGNAGPEMARLSMRLNDAISSLPDDNMIKVSNTPADQQIAFFAAGNYIFAVSGSLDSPSIFE